MLAKTVPYLGLEWQVGIADELGLRDPNAISVKCVMPESPAERCGIRAGDVIDEVDGVKVSPDQSLSCLINAKKPGTVVGLGICRGGRKLHLRVALGERQVPVLRFQPIERRAAVDK